MSENGWIGVGRVNTIHSDNDCKMNRLVAIPERLSVKEEALLVRIAHETPHADVRRYALATLERSKEQRE